MRWGRVANHPNYTRLSKYSEIGSTFVLILNLGVAFCLSWVTIEYDVRADACCVMEAIK